MDNSRQERILRHQRIDDTFADISAYYFIGCYTLQELRNRLNYILKSFDEENTTYTDSQTNMAVQQFSRAHFWLAKFLREQHKSIDNNYEVLG